MIELDQDAAVRRAALAREDRYVSIRPLPDTMAKITAVLPVEQAVACFASLRAAAETAKATGDERTKAQIKADTLVQRVTGQTTATAIPVEVQLVMTSDALLGRSEEPAQLPGHGPLPAFLARRIITRDPDATAARVWVRRLLTDPIDDTVATIDTKRRRFDGALAVLINARDQVCRDPYCSRPHPRPRPPPHLRDRWAHHSRQRHRALPTRQPGRPNPRLAHHRHRHTPGRHHPHRTPLRHPTTTRPRTPTTQNRQARRTTPPSRLKQGRAEHVHDRRRMAFALG